MRDNGMKKNKTTHSKQIIIETRLNLSLDKMSIAVSDRFSGSANKLLPTASKHPEEGDFNHLEL